jgi:D-arabinose 1-dehydrogenase-like Zn-dependent alcohol dehydrogenase
VYETTLLGGDTALPNNKLTLTPSPPSSSISEAFVCRIPDNLDLAAATPLLCAGITTYSPMLHYGLKASDKLAVLGLGGLGHMAVKVR